MFSQRIEGRIVAREVVIGKGAVVEADVLICAKDGGPADRVVLGDYCYIGRGVRIMAPEFRLGHYSKLHAGCYGHGVKPLQIGRNCWIGGGVVLDSMGGLDIDDNVGIGAGSQLWTHIQFGDVVEGCRFKSEKYMHVGKDAWLVGHCIVSPVSIGERAMALAGSVVTKDLLPNHVYGGVPAVDLTDKVGTQFEAVDDREKLYRMQGLIAAFEQANPQYKGWLMAVRDFMHGTFDEPAVTYFNVSQRTYNRTYSYAEVLFLKQHTPLVKFTPFDEPSFIQRSDERLQSSLQNEVTP